MFGIASPPPPTHLADPPRPSVFATGRDGGSSTGSLLIIGAVIAFVIATSASIHLLLRLLSRSRSPSSTSSLPSPTPLLDGPSANSATHQLVSEGDLLITSLPTFSLASSVSVLRKFPSLDCAVCLSTFRPQDELRLLPACRHAFHTQCIDTWLRSTPSCPLCRSSIHLPPAPSLPSVTSDSSRSRSFRVEIGSVSRRTTSVDGIPSDGATHGPSYSLGSSFEYLVDEEVEAVLERPRGSLESIKNDKPDFGSGVPPSPPGTAVAQAAGGSGRWWLRDYVDRLASSASSSFNSLRFSNRPPSHRFDTTSAAAGTGGSRSWDFEACNFAVEWEESGIGSFYRWLVGV
ncbi:hypothetical protein HPP92_025360 [Vanilla planifolia]|uniref:RING-type domain-containing protein n=1 Tax=Vanilla planifolia TaxID=51239 RepID=A0A835PHR2_VANPL|nr:hypothetical protein HPP92_025661 [Vanilla planifolia]KAG0454056.1 hypothetical protein HPP92_025360 [Vanilla planifolia]